MAVPGYDKTDYLERGVAALRAQSPISPSENWARCQVYVTGTEAGNGCGEDLEKGIPLPLEKPR